MVLIRVDNESYQEIGKGPIDLLFKIMDEYTERNEEKGNFLVNDEKLHNSYIREFASAEKGYVESLVICTNTVESNSVKKV